MKFITITLRLLMYCMVIISIVGAQTDSLSQSRAKNQKDKPLKIISKPQVSRDVFTKCLKDSVNTRLSVQMIVTFESSGQIGDVVIFRASGCEYFDEEATRAAKKIKFKPAVKDGEPITVKVILEYQAGVY